MASRRKTRVIRDRGESLSALTSGFCFAGAARVGPDRRVRPSSPLMGRSLRDARFSQGTLVASMSWDGEMLFPHADTALLARDVIAVVTEPHQASRVRAIADGHPGRVRGRGQLGAGTRSHARRHGVSEAPDLTVRRCRREFGHS